MKWACAIKSCKLPALATIRSACELCNRHFCEGHLFSKDHHCFTPDDIVSIYQSGDSVRLENLNSIRRANGERSLQDLLVTIDIDALRLHAETLREGLKCTVNLPSAEDSYFNFDVIGGCNYHATLIFEDGKTWLARFRIPNHNTPPLVERNFDRQSEYATYKYLAGLSLPMIPNVYAVMDDCDPTNAVGAGYLFLEKLQGRPATWYNATEKQKENFLGQLADLYIGLQRLPLDMIGRLHIAPGSDLPEVGTAFFEYNTSGEAVPLGPFQHANDYYKARIEQHISLLRNGAITAPNPVDAYLVYMTLLSNLPTDDSNTRYIQHIDSRDANFLVDDDYNITGIIDWELAIVTPEYSALQSPLLLFDLGEVYQNGLSTPSIEEAKFAGILKEKGHEDLARLASQKLGFRLEQCIIEEPHSPQFIPLLSGWWKLVHSAEDFDFESWRATALKKHGDGGFSGNLNL